MGRPRLIFLCTRFPFPPDRGDRLRAYYFLREFARHADVTLVAFTDRDPSDEQADGLRSLCARIEIVRLSPFRSQLNMVRALAGDDPLQVAYYRSGPMRRLMDRLSAERWDVAFGLYCRMLPYLERVGGRVRILDLSDSMTLRMRRAMSVARFPMRQVYAQEMKRVARFERRAVTGVDECWLVAEPDRDEIGARVPDARLRVVPNGIVMRWGHAGLEGPKEEEALFLGDMSVHHNRDAARFLASEVWPRVRARRRGARLRLIGAHGAGLRALHRPPAVSLEGYVDDLTPCFRRARLAVAPLRVASGLQNKVLETMAAGLPTVVTPVVATPIGAPADRALVVRDGAESLADGIVHLLENPREARAIGEAGAAWVRARFDWADAGHRLAEVLAQ